MSSLLVTLSSLTGVIICIAVAVALMKTGKPVRSLVGSSAQGLCALAAVNVAGAFTGVSLGLNLFSALCCIVLGIPGVVGLLVLKLLFRI